MNWNNIYKGIISIFILTPLAFAQNDQSLTLNNTNDISVLKDVKELKSLSINSFTLTQEDINTVCNLNNLETLILNCSIEEDVNFECFNNLEIKKLNVTMEERPKEILKYFPNLETLSLNPVNTFYQEELENIVGMKNLKNLTLDTINESSVDFEAITNTSSIRRFEFYNGKGDYNIPFTPNFFKIFSQIEEFVITNSYKNIYYIDQEEIDGLKTLKNLKKVIFGMVFCKDNIELDLGNLKDIIVYGYYTMGYVAYASEFYANCIRRRIEENKNYVYIYNRNRNKCLHSDGKYGKVTYGDCNDKLENILWIGSGNGSIFYADNPNCCFNGSSLSCGTYCVYGYPANQRGLEYWTINNHINKAPSGSSHLSGFGPIDICLGSKDKNSDELTLTECDDYDPDQIWEFNKWNWNSTEFVPPQKEEEQSIEEYIYIYNANRNECLTTSGVVGTPITYGKCDNSDNMVWITSNTNGHFRSKANPNYCMRPNDSNSEGTVILGKCSPIAHKNQFYREKNLLKKRYNSSYYKYCIGSSDKDPNQADIKECNEKDPDQIWYFNHWDSSVVVKDNAIVYFYNAFKNECIHTDGTLVATGSCDFSNDNTLWEIPNSHKGYYRSKANPEKCLSIVDGEVSLSECNEDNKLSLDGNFIRSLNDKDHCIASSKSGKTLEYIEGCNIEDPDHIWYVNIWTE